MKKFTTILLLLIVTTVAFSQKKQKIKGSKTVTTEQREVDKFSALEVEDNLEVYLEKGEKPGIKIEADDNLHDIIKLDLKANTLRLYTSKEARKYDKLVVKVTYTNDLNMVTAKHETTVNAIQEVQVDTVTFKALDYSKLYLNVNTKNFTLQANDKSETELNLKSEKARIELSDNASLKSLIATQELTSDLYQKSQAKLEGQATNATIRLDNNSSLTGNKLTIKNIDLVAESFSKCSVNAETSINITASGKSEIELYGEPKVEMKKFADEAKLFKKAK
jgi:hypothetical protein